MASLRARGWCFTINNPEDEDWIGIRAMKAKYWIVGNEVGEEETPHLQGYVCFTMGRTFSAVKKDLPRAHIEAAKGTQAQNIAYCSKDGDFEEFGERNAQGARGDLDRARTMAQEEGMRGVTQVCSMQQIQVAKAFLTYNEEPRDWKTEVVWFWGEPGAGKSRAAAEEGGEDCYRKGAGKWWDGYDGHEVVNTVLKLKLG